MRIQSLDLTNANRAWNQRENDGDIDSNDLTFDLIGNPEDDEVLSDFELTSLTERLEEARLKHNKQQIDGVITEIIHSELKDHADAHQFSQIGFWAWLSIAASDGYFWDFIDWRFESEKSKKLINWGVVSQTSAREAYFYRAWIRAQKMYDPGAADPYKYAKIGGSDMWRSHLLRVQFGKDREFIKALLDTVYDKNGRALYVSSDLRDLVIPSLRAWLSRAGFSHLSYQENLELIRKIIDDGI